MFNYSIGVNIHPKTLIYIYIYMNDFLEIVFSNRIFYFITVSLIIVFYTICNGSRNLQENHEIKYAYFFSKIPSFPSLEYRLWDSPYLLSFFLLGNIFSIAYYMLHEVSSDPHFSRSCLIDFYPLQTYFS